LRNPLIARMTLMYFQVFPNRPIPEPLGSQGQALKEQRRQDCARRQCRCLIETSFSSVNA
jgi:hypothetical protein